MRPLSLRKAGSAAVIVALVALSLAPPPTGAQDPTPVDLVLPFSPHQWCPLRQATDPELETKLKERLYRNDSWAALLSQGKMAVGLVDLRNPERARFASVNGDQMMYAASLPKIALLSAATHAIDGGELPESPELLADMVHMIRYSCNESATRILDRLGYRRIEAFLTDPRYQLYDVNHGGGLWVGKRYASSGERYPDPLKGLSHAATAVQVCRFYYLLATGRLVSAERSRQMLEMLSKPGIHHKFVCTLHRLAPEVSLYRKSGTWRQWHADSVLVWGKSHRRYILVGLVEDARGEQILQELVLPIEELLQQRATVRLPTP